MVASRDYYKDAWNALSRAKVNNLKITYILAKKEENGNESIKAVAYKEDEPDIIVGVDISEDDRNYRIPDWAFNIDEYLLDNLQNGFEIKYMPLEEHYGVWCCIDDWREEINSKEGLQRYLSHCHKKDINVKTLSLLEVDVNDIMDLYEEKNGNYKILTEMSIGKSAIVLAHNPNSPSPYVTWETAPNRNWGYQSGHYFTKYNDAFNDFKERSKTMFEFSMKHKKEQSRPKVKKEQEYER